MKKYYDILGIHYNANEKEIKHAYKELSKKYHPDKYFNNPLADLAAEKFREIQDAYQVLISNFENANFQINNNYLNEYDRLINSIKEDINLFKRKNNECFSYLIYAGVEDWRMRKANEWAAALRAIPVLEQAILLDNTRPEAYGLLGLAVLAKGMQATKGSWLEAEKHLKQAFMKGEKDFLVLYTYGKAMTRSRNYVAVIKILERCLNENDEDEDVLGMLAWSYQETDRKYEADIYWNRLKYISPNHYLLDGRKSLLNMVNYLKLKLEFGL